MAGTIRVLQVLGTTNRGGAESRIMDLYRHMNREDIQFDFLVHTEKKGYFDDEIKSLGGRIYHLPAFRVYNYFSYRKACKEFFTAHGEFAAVHGHMTSTASIYLPIAKKLGVPLTIAHARSAGVDQGVKGWMTRLLRRRLYCKADVLIACSDLAAEAVFGKSTVQQGQVLILPNAVDTGEFAYNARVREEMRQKLNITDKFVVGHVGRFHYAKNHEFLIDIFQEIKKQRQDALLLLAGDGSLQEMIKKKVDLLGLSESVIFAGAVSPISPWYQAMDCFLFPSRFEGMPGSVVEAQAAGLPCLISDAITRQVKATDLVEFVSLAQSPKEWADKLLTMSSRPRSRMAEEMRNSDYDVNQQVERYRNLYRRKEVN